MRILSLYPGWAPGIRSLPMQDAPSQAARQTTWSAGAAGDRLSSTIFLAALFHGILILGITFSAGPAEPDNLTSSMEVVLVTSDYEDRTPSASAVLLAQRNLAGVGNAAADAALRTAPGLSLPANTLGAPQDGGEAPVRPGQASPLRNPEPILLTRDSTLKVPDQGEPERAPERQQTMLPSTSNAIEIVGRFDSSPAIPDAQARELLISANTRESRLAAYLSTWKNKVEQVGTLNFPFAASQTATAKYPVLEVAINANGQLREVVVRNSSGQQDLDQAAMQILRLAAPFEPFPAGLRADYDVLRFAYEWRFSEGTGAVRASTAAAF
ncbi:MAG: energy transducer TonB [Gammaproteobacteria bacterium]|nr:energy transducer TonB [Gammaproteobacteria bacterium]